MCISLGIDIFSLIMFSNRVKVLFFIFSLDPTRLLLTFGASTTVQDKYQQNTALHWAILSKNHTAVTTLVMHGASLDISNSQVKKVPTFKLSNFVKFSCFTPFLAQVSWTNEMF